MTEMSTHLFGDVNAQERTSFREDRYSEFPKRSPSQRRESPRLRQRSPSPSRSSRRLPPLRGHSPHFSGTESNSSDLDRYEPDYDVRGPKVEKESNRKLDFKINALPPRQAKAVPSEVMKLTHRSNAEDVAAWLKYKGFRQRTIEILAGYTAKELFSLHLEDTQDVLSHEEAIRLDGLLRLQKSASGYATRSSKELNAILQRRKEHVNNTDWQTEADDATDGHRDNPRSTLQQHHQQAEHEERVELRRQPQNHRPPQDPSLPDYRKIDKIRGPGGKDNFKDMLVRQRSLLRQSQAEN